jgi:hypothetical protein
MGTIAISDGYLPAASNKQFRRISDKKSLELACFTMRISVVTIFVHHLRRSESFPVRRLCRLPFRARAPGGGNTSEANHSKDEPAARQRL